MYQIIGATLSRILSKLNLPFVWPPTCDDLTDPDRSNSVWSPGQTNSQINASFELAFHLATYLHELALALVELKFTHKLMQVFHHLATQHEPTQVDCKYMIMCINIYGFLRLAQTCEQLVNPFGHPSQSSCNFQFCKLMMSCISLGVHLARANKITHFLFNRWLKNISRCKMTWGFYFSAGGLDGSCAKVESRLCAALDDHMKLLERTASFHKLLRNYCIGQPKTAVICDLLYSWIIVTNQLCFSCCACAVVTIPEASLHWLFT